MIYLFSLDIDVSVPCWRHPFGHVCMFGARKSQADDAVCVCINVDSGRNHNENMFHMKMCNKLPPNNTERERANRWGEGTRSGTGEIKCRIISAINHLRVFARKMPCTRAYDFFLLFRFSNISDEDCSSRKSRKKCVHAVLFTIEMAAKLSASYQMKRRTQRNYTCSLLDIVDTVWHRLWFTTPPPFNSVTHRRNPKHFVRVCTVDACE